MTKQTMEIELTAAKARELARDIREATTKRQVANAIASIKAAAEKGKYRVAIDGELTVPAQTILKALGYILFVTRNATEVSW